MKKNYISKSEKETMRIAGNFALSLRGGEIVLLEGELGSGKSTFVRGMGAAFGIRKPLCSPTFTLMNLYENLNNKVGVRNFVHADAYRLENAEDLRDIGLWEYIGEKDTVVVIEWGEKAKGVLKKNKIINICFWHGADINKRIIEIN